MIDLRAWESEPRTKDEQLRTPFAPEGWKAWNGRSPELEFCDFAQSLVALVRPKFVIETGVGQGYMTRRIAESLPEESRLLCFESDHEWRQALAELPFWRGASKLGMLPSPEKEVMESCDLLVADSTYRFRRAEIELWTKFAPDGSYLLVHDVSRDHPEESVHQRLFWLIESLEIEGIYLSNPRGGFLGRK